MARREKAQLGKARVVKSRLVKGMAGRRASEVRARRRDERAATLSPREARRRAARSLPYTSKFHVIRRKRLLGKSRSCGLVVEHQQQTLWCWAAIANSMSHFYEPDSKWTQCRVANAELAQAGCCEDGSTSACNQPWYLDKALKRVDCLLSMTPGVLSFATVRSLINASSPPCARQQWSGGGGHFVAIACWFQGSIGVLVKGRSAAKRVRVSDPWYGDTVLDYGDFVSRYLGGGTWTHSYRTQA